MRILSPSGLEFFCPRRRYFRKYLIGTRVAAVLIALCLGWPVYDAAAQTNDATDDGILTVGKCLANANISEAAAKGTDRHLFGEEALVSLRLGEEADDIAVQAQYPVGPVEETFVKEGIIRESLLSTKVTNGMCQDMLERAPDDTLLEWLVTAQNYTQDLKLIQNAIPDDETPAGSGGARTRAESSMQQAATTSSIARAVVAEGDASIPDMLDQIEAALIEEGIPRSEAISKARCSLEEELLNAISKEISRGESIRVTPEPTPKELEQGDTIPVKLVMSGAIREVYGKLVGQYEQVAEASEAKDGCVQLDGTVKAALYDDRFAVSSRRDSLIRPMTHDATWRWDLSANREGKNSVGVLLGPVLQHAEQDLQPKWIQPAVLDAKITVKEAKNWWWLLPVGIVLMVAAALLAWILRNPSEPGGHG